MAGWSLTVLSTQCTLYRTFKVELYYNLISISSWGNITEKEKYNNNSRFRLNK